MNNRNKILKKLGLSASVALFSSAATAAFAANTNANAPWETALKTLTTSFSGPVAKGIGIVMMVIAGAQLLRGTEFQTWMYSLLVGGLAVVTMGNADSIMALLGVNGCLI